jgi:hypothetical protein
MALLERIRRTQAMDLSTRRVARERPSTGETEDIAPHRDAEKTESLRTSIFAIASVTLESDDTAIVGRNYAVSTGLSRELALGFVGEAIDFPTTSQASPMLVDITFHARKNVGLSSDWKVRLEYDFSSPKPQLVTFLFFTIAAGDSSFCVDFYHERRWLRNLQFDFTSLELPEPSLAGV